MAKKRYHYSYGEKIEIKTVLNPHSKSKIEVFLDEKGIRRWRHK